MPKVSFCTTKETIFFLKIFQGYGVSRRVLGEWIRPFQRIMLSSRSLVNYSTPDDEGNTIIRNVGNYSPKTLRDTPEQKTPLQQGCDSLKTLIRWWPGQTVQSQGAYRSFRIQHVEFATFSFQPCLSSSLSSRIMNTCTGSSHLRQRP